MALSANHHNHTHHHHQELPSISTQSSLSQNHDLPESIDNTVNDKRRTTLLKNLIKDCKLQPVTPRNSIDSQSVCGAVIGGGGGGFGGATETALKSAAATGSALHSTTNSSGEDGYVVLTFNNKRRDLPPLRQTAIFSDVGAFGALPNLHRTIGQSGAISCIQNASDVNNNISKNKAGIALINKKDDNNNNGIGQRDAPTNRPIKHLSKLEAAAVAASSLCSSPSPPSSCVSASTRDNSPPRIVICAGAAKSINPSRPPACSTTTAGVVATSLACLDPTTLQHDSSFRRMLRCRNCGKHYRNDYSMQHHICLRRKDVWRKGDVARRLINGQLVYFCPMCEKPFRWMGNLTRHFYVHTGQRFFRCDICQKEFFSAYQVRRHMNSHTGMRYKCTTCEKPFTCKYACMWHSRQHCVVMETAARANAGAVVTLNTGGETTKSNSVPPLHGSSSASSDFISVQTTHSSSNSSSMSSNSVSIYE